jgi:hypothetical protein
MRTFITVSILFGCGVFLQSHHPVPPGKVVAGIFDGRTPCQELASRLDEEATKSCIKIKWRLILFKDSVSGNPAGYEMTGFVYKRQNPRRGEWKILKGVPSNPNAVVVELAEKDRPSLYLLKADENVFFFLDENKNLMVGNRDFSYTLNRKN